MTNSLVIQSLMMIALIRKLNGIHITRVGLPRIGMEIENW